MRIGVIPSSIHQRDSCVSPPSENALQNGVPLSLIIWRGMPNSRNTRSKPIFAPAMAVEVMASMANTYRLNGSAIVSG